MRLKILVVNSLYFPNEFGGAESGVRLLVEGLAAEKVDVVVATLAAEGSWQQGTVNDIPVIRMPLRNIYWPFERQKSASIALRPIWHALDAYNPIMERALASVIDEVKPHVVHLNNVAGFSSSAVQAAKSRGVPVVQTLHDYYWACPRSDMFRNGRNCTGQCQDCHIYTWGRRRVAPSIDAVCGVSEAVLTTVEKYTPFSEHARREIIYNLNRPAPALTLRNNKAPFERTTIGYIGRLHPTKGIETIFEALRQLQDLPVNLKVAGRGQPDYEAQLRELAEGLPAQLVGYRDPTSFFSEIDLLVVPSIWNEPFGRVVQEAFACGVPVIGTDRGGIPEALGPGNPAGLRFEAGNSTQLAAIVRQIISTGLPAADLTKAALERSAAFEPSAIIPKQVSLYEELAGEAPPRG